MFDTLPVGIVFAEMPSGRVTEGNARVEQILGYTAFASIETAALEDWTAFDEDGQRVPVEHHPLYVAVSAGETASRVFHHQRGDGTRVWVAMIAAPVRDAGHERPDRRDDGGDRTVFSEEGGGGRAVRLVVRGEMDVDLIEAVEDFLRRQKRRLTRA